MRAAFGLAATLLATAGWANGTWRVTQETAAEVVAIDVASFERTAGGVRFRERHTLRGGQTDPHTLRVLREVLAKRVIDCRRRRIATLSRAVFDTDDALIGHQAVRLQQAVWQPVRRGEAVFRLACRPS